MSVAPFPLLFTSAWYAASYLPHALWNLGHLLTAGTLLYLLYLPERKTVIPLLFNNEMVY